MFTIIGGDGREYGPASAEQIRRWIAAGRANLDTRAKASGTDEWKPLSEFSEIVVSPSVEPPPLDAAARPVLAQAPGAANFALPLGSRAARLIAVLIDNVIAALCFLPFVVAVGIEKFQQIEMHPDDAQSLLSSTMATAAPGIGLMAMLLLVLVVTQVTLLSFRGQTLGKLIMRVRIVRFPDGAPAGFVRACLIRSILVNLAYCVLQLAGPAMPALAALVDICFIFRPDRRCLHDLIAGTMVVPA